MFMFNLRLMLAEGVWSSFARRLLEVKILKIDFENFPARATKAGMLGPIPGWVTEGLRNGTCGLASLVLGVNGWVQANSSHAVLPLTRHQCSIHCESSCVPRRKLAEVERRGPLVTFRNEYKRECN